MDWWDEQDIPKYRGSYKKKKKKKAVAKADHKHERETVLVYNPAATDSYMGKPYNYAIASRCKICGVMDVNFPLYHREGDFLHEIFTSRDKLIALKDLHCAIYTPKTPIPRPKKDDIFVLLEGDGSNEGEKM